MLILPDAIRKTRLISDEYRDLQSKLHKNKDYGTTSAGYAKTISNLCNQYQVTELLDYGCGKQMLAKGLAVDHAMSVQMYDPALPEFADDPEPSELVCCMDVLEHIEPQLLDNVLDDLQRLTKRIGVFTVSCEPAQKYLEDGRNAHLIVEPPQWWLPKLMERFDLHVFQKRPDGFLVLIMAHGIEQDTH